MAAHNLYGILLYHLTFTHNLCYKPGSHHAASIGNAVIERQRIYNRQLGVISY